ncbi:protein NLP3 [Hordeum vulgare]|uniref:protein NLP3-like n=1 Tax=Hordeum vulgare subsp. vulgare TaxID=112509 RepID=UPI001D1A3B6B|nr:protein NLP3-like [Hordeum vulgare subsp. vulgare]KAE8801814.1 protein NLP3 [Hordeum vulgare]
MDLVSPACNSGEYSDIIFMDEESMRLAMAWSPPPSPPASVGFGGRISPLDTALIPAQASERPRYWRRRTWRWNSSDFGYKRPLNWVDMLRSCIEFKRELEHVSSKWHPHAPLHDGSTDGSCLLKERLTHAFQYLKESTDSCLLAQVWETVKHQGRHVLTTSGQPFVFSNQNTGLLQFRDASMMQIIPPDSTNAGEFGVTGPVFSLKVPEWGPSCQCYNSEYPLPDQALRVFDPHTKSCVAVVQLMMLTQKVDFEPEIDLMCKGLEAVNLTSTYMPSRPSAQISTRGDFGSPQFSDVPVTGNGELKETDAPNQENGQCESALVLDISKRMRGNTENAASSIKVVQHNPSTQSINRPRSKPKPRSIAWHHFKREDGARAICNYCKKVYAADTIHHGTSRLLRHLEHAHGIDPKASSSDTSRN